MPWRCERCGVEVAEDGHAQCPACQTPKSAWTLHAEQTRRFVLTGKKVLVLRGQDASPRAADDPARARDGRVEATRAISVPKTVARDAAARGLLPASRDLLFVRLVPRGARTLTVELAVDFAARETETHALEPLSELDGDGEVDVPILLVHGEGGLEGLEFPGVHVVDVTEDAGHALQVEVVALKKRPVRLPIGGHFAAVRLLEPDGRPAAGVGVALILPDGTRREATTDDEGGARWEDVPSGGPVQLELLEPEFVPDVLDATPSAEAAPSPPPPPDADASPPEPVGDEVEADDEALPKRVADVGTGWTAVRLVEPDGRPAAHADVVLVQADGQRRAARTDADGFARWDGVAGGPLALELVDPAFVPDVAPLADEDEPPPPAHAPRHAPPEVDPHDIDLTELDVSDLQLPRRFLA